MHTNEVPKTPFPECVHARNITQGEKCFFAVHTNTNKYIILTNLPLTHTLTHTPLMFFSKYSEVFDSYCWSRTLQV